MSGTLQTVVITYVLVTAINFIQLITDTEIITEYNHNIEDDDRKYDWPDKFNVTGNIFQISVNKNDVYKTGMW